MTTTLRVIAVSCSMGFLLLILELVRRKKLRENYSLTWFFVGVMVLVFSAFADRLTFIVGLLGFVQASNAIIVFSIFLILVILLGVSVAVSRLSIQTQTLAQEIGLLKNRLEAGAKIAVDGKKKGNSTSDDGI